MTPFSSDQILKGEEGYTDFSGNAPASPEPVRVVTPRQTRAQEHETLQKIAARVESALKELRKPKGVSAERLAELESQLRSDLPALSGELTARARRTAEHTLAALFAPRYRRLARLSHYTAYCQIVVDSKIFAQKCATARDHAILIECAAKAVELYRSECQSETV